MFCKWRRINCDTHQCIRPNMNTNLHSTVVPNIKTWTYISANHIIWVETSRYQCIYEHKEVANFQVHPSQYNKKEKKHIDSQMVGPKLAAKIVGLKLVSYDMSSSSRCTATPNKKTYVTISLPHASTAYRTWSIAFPPAAQQHQNSRTWSTKRK